MKRGVPSWSIKPSVSLGYFYLRFDVIPFAIRPGLIVRTMSFPPSTSKRCTANPGIHRAFEGFGDVALF